MNRLILSIVALLILSFSSLTDAQVTCDDLFEEEDFFGALSLEGRSYVPVFEADGVTQVEDPDNPGIQLLSELRDGSIAIRFKRTTLLEQFDVKSETGRLIPDRSQPPVREPFEFLIANTETHYAVAASLGSNVEVLTFDSGVGFSGFASEFVDDVEGGWAESGFLFLSVPTCIPTPPLGPAMVPEPSGALLSTIALLGALCLCRGHRQPYLCTED